MLLEPPIYTEPKHVFSTSLLQGKPTVKPLENDTTGNDTVVVAALMKIKQSW